MSSIQSKISDFKQNYAELAEKDVNLAKQYFRDFDFEVKGASK